MHIRSLLLASSLAIFAWTTSVEAAIRTCGGMFARTRLTDLQLASASDTRTQSFQVGDRSFEIEVSSRFNQAIESQSALRDVQPGRHLSVVFKNLGRTDVEFLAAFFGTPRGRVRPGREVNLADFLPREMSHFLDRTYKSSAEPLPAWGEQFLAQPERGDEHFIFSSMNCWGTVWEMTRLANPIHRNVTRIESFYASADAVKDYLFSPQYSSAIAESDLSFGDVVMIGKKFSDYRNPGDSSLLHAAIYLGGGFVFEKVGTPEKYGFRIIDLRSNIEGHVELYSAEEIEVAYRRFNGSNHTPLPAPSAVLALQHSHRPEQLRQVPRNEWDAIIVTLDEVGLMGRLEASFSRIVREIIPR